MTREKEYQKRKQQRLERKAQGVCTRCGCPLDNALYVQCKRCRDKFRLVYYPMSTLAGKRRASCDRGRNGDCWQCGQLLPQGYTKKICPQCIEKRLHGREVKRLENLHQRPDNKQSEV